MRIQVQQIVSPTDDRIFSDGSLATRARLFGELFSIFTRAYVGYPLREFHLRLPGSHVVADSVLEGTVMTLLRVLGNLRRYHFRILEPFDSLLHPLWHLVMETDIFYRGERLWHLDTIEEIHVFLDDLFDLYAEERKAALLELGGTFDFRKHQQAIAYWRDYFTNTAP